MIVVDTSALMAIILDEPPAVWLERQLQAETGAILISAGTIAECLIVATGRRALADMELLLSRLGSLPLMKKWHCKLAKLMSSGGKVFILPD